jgi:hypothetical protein
MGFQLLHRAATAASMILSAVVLPATLSAQAVVRGILYDDATGAPVRGTVMLVDPRNDAPVVHMATDSLGQFNLQAGTGVYQIAAVRSGYTSVLSAPVSFQSGERLTIRVPIAQTGDPQHQIGVLEHVRPEAKVQEGRRADVMSSFEARRITGTGLHYDRQQLEKSNVNTLGELLQSVPGFNVVDPSSTSSMQMARTANYTMGLRGPTGGTCHVGWFVDGHRVDLPGRSDPMTDGLGQIQIDAIEAVEVFRGLSEMPPEFAAPDLRCGAVAIWSRKG